MSPFLAGSTDKESQMTSCPSPSGCRGFVKNVLEQKSSERKDIMVSYLSDLREDATDLKLRSKAAHAVLLCEMEWGSLQW